MNDDIWDAFAQPAEYREPVTNRDNSLSGLQRRLLEECGYKLDETQQRLAYTTERLAVTDDLLARCYKLLLNWTREEPLPNGLGDLLVDIADFYETDNA